MHQDEPSLLSHLEHIRSTFIPEGGISNVIFCGKIRNEADLPAALLAHRAIVEEEVNKGEANVTGILMGQGNTVLHLLEGPCFSILRILDSLAKHEHFASAIQSGNIVFNVEDRPKRYFPEWYSCTIQEKKSTGDEITEENCNDIVFEMSNTLLEVGEGLKNEIQQDELDLGRYASQLPGKNLIAALASSDCFFSLQDYVDFYYEPYHIELESEGAWPLERLVQY